MEIEPTTSSPGDLDFFFTSAVTGMVYFFKYNFHENKHNHNKNHEDELLFCSQYREYNTLLFLTVSFFLVLTFTHLSVSRKSQNSLSEKCKTIIDPFFISHH